MIPRKLLYMFVALIAWVTVHDSLALAPHELLVLANRNEPTSVRIARSYMQKRNVPRQNLVLLNLCPDKDGDYVQIGRGAFHERIWQPVQQHLQQRNLHHILAWVFSTHIPFRVDHDPPVSVQGLVFVRNRIPSSDAIARAEYASPLFVGPMRPDDEPRAPFSLQRAAAGLRGDMPIPSMALGYIGTGGNTESEIMDMLDRSVSADALAPSGTVYLITGEDIRARSREWQFAPVQDRLRAMGISSVITNMPPSGENALLGVMMGARRVDAKAKGTFMPGAFAEHFTSYGAKFDESEQTKVTRWISAGASGTVGTVTEPYAVWAKFPHARFYEHYMSGFTLLESLYLAVRMPLQSFMIGDPLTRPWAPSATVKLTGLRNQEVVRNKREVSFRIDGGAERDYSRSLFLLNGVIVRVGRTYVLDPVQLDPGLYELRVVVYRLGNMTSPVTDTVRFQVRP